MPQLTVSQSSSHRITGLEAGADYVFRVGVADGDGVVRFSDWSETFTAVAPMNGTIQPGQDIDIGTGKILYSNVYQTLADLPDAAGYHGMFAHVHAEGAAYYAHAGNWVRLADNSDIPTTFVSGLNGLTGSVTLAGGQNVQVSQLGNQLTISSTQSLTTLNGESGALSLVGGNGIGVNTVDNVLTVFATDHTAVNNLTGNVGVVGGEGIYVTTNGQDVVIASEGVTWSTPPADPSSAGDPGDVAYDNDFFYVRTSAEWRRAALSTWAPTITIELQPQNMTLADGGSGDFTIAATVSDGSTPSYQWQNSDDSGATWDTITGSTGTTYSLSGVSTLDNGTQYRAIVSAAGASDVTSSVATLTVAETFDVLAENGDRLMTEGGDSLDHDGLPPVTITFTTQPQNATVLWTDPTYPQTYRSVTLSAQAEASDGSQVQYDWQELYNGQWVSTGQTTPSIAISAEGFDLGNLLITCRVVASSATAPDAISDVATVSPENMPTVSYTTVAAVDNRYSVIVSEGVLISWVLTGPGGQWSSYTPSGDGSPTYMSGASEQIYYPAADPYPVYHPAYTNAGTNFPAGFTSISSGIAVASPPAEWPAGTYTFEGVVVMGGQEETVYDAGGTAYTILLKKRFKRTFTVT